MSAVKTLSNRPTSDPDLVLALQDLTTKLAPYGEIPGTQQTSVKYIKLIDEITNPESVVYQQIKLIAQKMPLAVPLLRNVDASHSRVKEKLQEICGELLHAERVFIDSIHRDTRALIPDISREHIEYACNNATTTEELVGLFAEITNPNGDFQKSRLEIDSALLGPIDLKNPTARQIFRQCQKDLKTLEKQAQDLVQEYGISVSLVESQSRDVGEAAAAATPMPMPEAVDAAISPVEARADIDPSVVKHAKKVEALLKKHQAIDGYEQKFVQDIKTLSDIEAIPNLDAKVRAKALFVEEKMTSLGGGMFSMQPTNYLAKIDPTISAPILESQNLKEYAESACNETRGENAIRNSELNQVIGHIKYIEASGIVRGRIGKDRDLSKVNDTILEKMSELPDAIRLAAKMAYVEDNMDKHNGATINIREPNPSMIKRFFSPTIERTVTLSEFGQKSILDAYRDMHCNDIAQGMQRIDHCIGAIPPIITREVASKGVISEREVSGSFAQNVLSQRETSAGRGQRL